jgi:hypothetical protein
MVSNCGKDYDGKPGDSSGKEYAVKPWYKHSAGYWVYCLRHPDATIRATIARLAIDAANNDNIGYIWGGSSMGTELAKVGYEPSRITNKCGSDCSGSTSYIVNAAGHLCNDSKLSSFSKHATGGLKDALVSAGFGCLTDRKYLTSDQYLLAGDILVIPNHHACINVGDGVSATSDTNWQATATNSSGTTGVLYTSSYTREDGIVREYSYLDDDYKYSLQKSKLKVSIINYTSMLQNLADVFGVSTSGAITVDSSSDTTIGGTSGDLAGRSGKSLSVKKTITIPDNVRTYLHNKDDCTSYSYWCHKLGWTQGKVAKVWIDNGQPHDSRNIGTLGGHLTIAMKETFGDCGDLVKVTCTDGTSFTAVLVDIKGSDATSRYGHVKGNDVSPCEWYVYTGQDTVNTTSTFKGIGDWAGKKVCKVENYGSWLDN